MATSFSDQLLMLLPELYRLEDAKIDGVPLQTFLSLVGLSLDELQVFIDDLPSLTSIDGCPERFLPFLAAIVGAQLDSKASAGSQRQVIRDSIERYRRKGTFAELTRDLQRFGWQGTVDELFADVNRLGRRATLGRQKLAGKTYNFGVYRVNGALMEQGFLERVYWHHPAGRRVIIAIDTVVTENATLSAPTLGGSMLVTIMGSDSSRIRLNRGALNRQQALTTDVSTSSVLRIL